VLKAEWHWGSDISVLKDPLGEPGRTPFYVGLRSAWGSVVSDCVFSSISWKRFLTGESDDCKGMNKLLVLEMEHLSS
jgi:hypothetical protein